MRLADFDRFDPATARVFSRLFGLALLANVVTEIRAGVWRVHAGELYPWRHLPLVPLYPTWALAIEWAVAAAAGVFCLLDRRLGPRLAAVALFAGLTQRYSNHAVLLFLVALFASLPGESADRSTSSPLGLARAQLLLVYAFGALNKITHGFLSGAALAHLFAASSLSTPGRDVVLAHPTLVSWAVVGVELALPVVLWFLPRVGIAGVVLLHLAFSIAMPGLVSFGLGMIAIAVLFLPPRPAASQAATGTG